MSTQERLDAYLAAEAAILKGQEYRFGERALTRADLAEVRMGIGSLKAELRREQGRHNSLSAASAAFPGGRW
jgi:hypothetical protein